MKYIALQKNPNLQLPFNREFWTLMESVPFHREEKDMKGFRLSQKPDEDQKHILSTNLQVVNWANLQQIYDKRNEM